MVFNGETGEALTEYANPLHSGDTHIKTQSLANNASHARDTDSLLTVEVEELIQKQGERLQATDDMLSRRLDVLEADMATIKSGGEKLCCEES